jgi:topoisomerase-4 subunit A
VLQPSPVPDGSDLLVAAATNEGRLLVFPLSDLPELARGKGNKIIGIPSARAAAREEILVGVCVIGEQDILQVTAGRQHLKLKAADLANYRGERGRRGNRLPKGFQKVMALSVIPRA